MTKAKATDFHKPVLLHEVVEYLQVCPGNCYIDATLGGGGHTIEIIRHGGEVLGIDRDSNAIYHTRMKLLEQLAPGYTGSYTLVKGNFKNLKRIATTHGFEHVDGILMDLGVSSFQIDNSTRGFTFRKNEPLDMRMDFSSPLTAAEILNSYTTQQLYEIFLHFGETHLARKLADYITDTRGMRPFTTTGQLVEAVEKVTGNKKRKFGHHPATTVFQALRIEVNEEMSNLTKGLYDATSLLAERGRVAVISFHSLEDRMVKLFFRGSQELEVITSHPIVPSEQEVAANRRARSAKLRVAEKRTENV
jgi:16S rRNA (cytosine1402-N4)-methyltransferase